MYLEKTIDILINESAIKDTAGLGINNETDIKFYTQLRNELAKKYKLFSLKKVSSLGVQSLISSDVKDAFTPNLFKSVILQMNYPPFKGDINLQGIFIFKDGTKVLVDLAEIKVEDAKVKTIKWI